MNLRRIASHCQCAKKQSLVSSGVGGSSVRSAGLSLMYSPTRSHF